MAISKKIIVKISEKAKDLPSTKECLIKILDFESGNSPSGWYTDEYKKIISDCAKGEDDENIKD